MTSLPRPSSLFPLFPSPWRPSSLRPPCLHAVFSPSALNSSAFNIIRGACGDFVPSPLLRSTHLQSLMGTALWRRKPTEYSDWNIVSRDGGTLALVEQAMAPETDSDEAPVLVVLPGLTGTKDSKYITNLVVQAAQAGFRAIVVNWRGFTTPLTSAIVSTAMDTSDAVTVLTKVKEKYPCAKGIFAVGFSAGANYLIKALGEHQNELGSIVTGAVAVSNPFDYVSLSQNLQKPVNSLLYSRGLALRLHALVFRKEENARILKECGKFDFESLMSSFSIYAIDDNFSKHMYGIKDVIEYYKESSSLPFLSKIRTNTLLLNSLDDIFLGAIPERHEIESNRHLMLLATDSGGHVAWKKDLSSSWMFPVIFNYIMALKQFHS